VGLVDVETEKEKIIGTALLNLERFVSGDKPIKAKRLIPLTKAMYSDCRLELSISSEVVSDKENIDECSSDQWQTEITTSYAPSE
jgi:hypothetical protein